MPITRRSFLNTAPMALIPALVPDRTWPHPFAPDRTSPHQPAPDRTFPTQSPDLAQEMVGASHNNLPRVKELLAIYPTLARAAWDWGFGDWEDALGAASHVGNRDIATLLLANGARPTIFSAAMLGQLDVVKAFIATSPGIEATPGPHGITLLRHAINGGPGGKAVADYLQTLPASDRRPASAPIATEQLQSLAGDYVFGASATERIVIAVTNGALTFTRSGRAARGLTHVGDLAFFPAGAPLVRIQFRAIGSAMVMTVHDPDLVLEARRAS